MSDKKTVNEYIFTFSGSQYIDDIWVGKAFVIINAPSMAEARAIMFKVHGEKWASAYYSKEEAGVDKYGLTMFAQYDYEEASVL